MLEDLALGLRGAESVSAAGMMVGAAELMSPEQATATVDHRSEVRQGCVVRDPRLSQAFSGKRPTSSHSVFSWPLGTLLR